jgi:hypothetical protein
MKDTDPGFATERPFPPRGKPIPIPHPGPYLVIFSTNVALSRRACERSRKHPAESGASVCHGTQDDLGSSNMRATLLTHLAVRVGRLICAKHPIGAYLIGRDSATRFYTAKKRGSANRASDARP